MVYYCLFHACTGKLAEGPPTLITHQPWLPTEFRVVIVTVWRFVRGSISPLETSGRTGGYRLTGASAACAESTEGFVFFGVV